ncbi:MAG: hypothetical protein E2O84_02800, partial [Bacteroidetes bacterium]
MKSIIGVLSILVTITMVGDLRAQISEGKKAPSQSNIDSFPSRIDTLVVQGQGPFLIHPFLLENTIIVYIDQKRVAREEFELDLLNGLITFINRVVPPSALFVVQYRYIPLDLASSYRIWPLRINNTEMPDSSPIRSARASDLSFSVPTRSNLRSSGSITRGVSTGTGQSAGIESGLRVQVEGEITEGIYLQAALTDENTPILPEGTTRRINEFDRIFIKLQSQSGTVQLGDFDARVDGGYYGRLRRKQQGVSVKANIPASGSIFNGANIQTSGSISRGIFRSQQVQAIDRIQGPYRLEGVNGERFIIVIPASESVFINGVRLVRGDRNDYVVDYETGEITFTPSQIISADLRITVEFEYTTSQFTRTMFTASGDTHFGGISDGGSRLTLGATVLRESDSKAFGSEFGLSAEDISIIEAAGDGLAFRSGAIAVFFNPEATYTQYLIEQRETISADTVNIFVAVSTTPPDTATVYRVSFSRLGERRGSYIRTGLVTNGIAYEWVGIGQGEYEPIQLLPTPVLNQIIDFRARVVISSGFSLSAELASSLQDLNRISELDDQNNAGEAYRIEANYSTGKSKSIGLNIFQRYRSSSFRTFSRSRSIEFARDWNLVGRIVDPTGGISGAQSERESDANVFWHWTDSSRVEASLSHLKLGSTFEGLRAGGGFKLFRSESTFADYSISFLETDDFLADESGSWIRQKGRISYGIKKDRIRPYFSVEHEDHQQTEGINGVLVAPSTRFIDSRGGVAVRGRIYEARFEIRNRQEDFVVLNGNRQPYDALTFVSSGSYDPGRHLHIEGTVGLRSTRGSAVSDILVPAASSDGSLLIGLNGRWRSAPSGFTVNWLYQAQSERSTVLQEIYIRTGQDRGEFVWIDINNDSVMQLEEFIPETLPNEGQFIRSYFPSDDFEEITTAKARIRFEYRHPGSQGTASGTTWNRFIRGIGSVTLIDVEERSR